MPKTLPFELYTRKYEIWFEENIPLYLSELNLLKELIHGDMTIEVGCGSGRFAIPLGIKIGIEPSYKMAGLSRAKGLDVIIGIAESIPLMDEIADTVLMVTTICFVDDVIKSLMEIYRILKRNGKVVIGFVDRDSELGKFYESIKDKNPFYKYAKFFSCSDVINFLKSTGFKDIRTYQTLFGSIDRIAEKQQFQEGCGKGGFVAISASK